MNALLEELKQEALEAAEYLDHTKTSSSFQIEVPPEGKTKARLSEYIEIGVHPRPAFKGKEKAPAPMVLVAFELLGDKHIREIEVEGVKKKIANRVTLPKMALLLDSKASFKKLFEKLKYGRDSIKCMPQMIGDEYIVNIVHNVIDEGTDKERTYANIKDAEGNFLISPPVIDVYSDEGEIVETKRVPVPELIGSPRMFIWSRPNKVQWDSLFIDGEREVTDKEGKSITVSNNWIQNMIMDAENFKGSPIDIILSGEGLPDSFEEVLEPKEKVQDIPSKPETTTKKTKEVTSVEDAADDTVHAAMKELDLL